MITLIRYIRLKQLEIKWKLAALQFIDKLAKNPEELEKKFIPYIAEIVHKQVQQEKKEAEV